MAQHQTMAVTCPVSRWICLGYWSPCSIRCSLRTMATSGETNIFKAVNTRLPFYRERTPKVRCNMSGLHTLVSFDFFLAVMIVVSCHDHRHSHRYLQYNHRHYHHHHSHSSDLLSNLLWTRYCSKHSAYLLFPITTSLENNYAYISSFKETWNVETGSCLLFEGGLIIICAGERGLKGPQSALGYLPTYHSAAPLTWFTSSASLWFGIAGSGFVTSGDLPAPLIPKGVQWRARCSGV